MRKNLTRVSAILFLIAVPIYLFGQIAAEKYFQELTAYINKIDKENSASSKDWESYVRKIYPENSIKITIDSALTEKQKKEYLKSIALALLFAKNQFDFKMPAYIKEFKCNRSVPGTYGTTEGPINNVAIICPLESTNHTTIVFLHELGHMILKHPNGTGPQHEQSVHDFIRKYLPQALDQYNRPRSFDIFSTTASEKDKLIRQIKETQTEIDNLQKEINRLKDK